MAVSNPGLPHLHIPKGVDHFIFPSKMRFAKVRFLIASTAWSQWESRKELLHVRARDAESKFIGYSCYVLR